MPDNSQKLEEMWKTTATAGQQDATDETYDYYSAYRERGINISRESAWLRTQGPAGRLDDVFNRKWPDTVQRFSKRMQQAVEPDSQVLKHVTGESLNYKLSAPVKEGDTHIYLTRSDKKPIQTTDWSDGEGRLIGFYPQWAKTAKMIGSVQPEIQMSYSTVAVDRKRVVLALTQSSKYTIAMLNYAIARLDPRFIDPNDTVKLAGQDNISAMSRMSRTVLQGFIADTESFLSYPGDLACCLIRNLMIHKPDGPLAKAYVSASEEIDNTIDNWFNRDGYKETAKDLQTIRALLACYLSLAETKSERGPMLFSLSAMLDEVIQTTLCTMLGTGINLVSQEITTYIEDFLMQLPDKQSAAGRAIMLECTPYRALIEALFAMVYDTGGLLDSFLSEMIRANVNLGKATLGKLKGGTVESWLTNEYVLGIVKNAIVVIDWLLLLRRPDTLCKLNYNTLKEMQSGDRPTTGATPPDLSVVDNNGVQQLVLSKDGLRININRLFIKPTDEDLVGFMVLTGLSEERARENLKPEIQKVRCQDVETMLAKAGCVGCGVI